MNTQLNRVRMTIVKRPAQETVNKKIEEANAKFLNISARMQPPKVNNW